MPTATSFDRSPPTRYNAPLLATQLRQRPQLANRNLITMRAKMKCSHCGAEMSNLNLSWGWKPFLITIPIMLLSAWPLLRMTYFKGDVIKELVVSEVQQRTNDGNVEIVGLITNSGSHSWSSVTVEAEFFDAAGAFIDEATEYLHTNFAVGTKEHFKLTVRSPSPAVTAPGTKLEVKVAGGHTFPF